METIILNATKRNKKGNAVRAEGKIPAVIYGKGKDNQSLSINMREFEKVFKIAGQSAIIDLDIEGDKKKVLIQGTELHPVTDETRHIDFYEVSMTEKITTNVPLKFIGEAPAVADLGGILITNENELEVECLPLDLPHEIEIDISTLVNFEISIHVSDVKISDKVEIKDDVEGVIISVEPPRTEEELAELEEPVEEGEMPEAEQSGEEEPAEGEEGEEKSGKELGGSNPDQASSDAKVTQDKSQDKKEQKTSA